MNLLKTLSETPGISGREDEIRDLIRDEMKSLVDEVRTDRLGNVIGCRKGDGDLKVMVSAHMDEIGFIVSHIDDSGFIRLNPVGGFDPRVLVARRVIVHGKEKYSGVIGSKPIHILSEEEKKKKLEIKDLFVDIGLSGEEAKKQISVGDPVTYDAELLPMAGSCCSGKCLDDRIGVYILLKTLKKLKKHKADIYAVASVQEEVGLRGAVVSAFDIEPDIGVALDVTLANDTPGSSPEEQVTRLGEGTAINIMNSVVISNYKLVDYLKEIAEEKNIKYQLEILPRGGTDAGAIQRAKAGAPVVTVSTPLRYVHSGYEMVNMDDVEESIKLLTAFLEKAHQVDLGF